MSRLEDDEARRIFQRTVDGIFAIVEARDPISALHAKRATTLSLEIGKELGFDHQQLELLRCAVLLHDVGRIGIREAVLTKRERLDQAERDHIQTHAAIGKQILQTFGGRFVEISKIAGAHHERYDGRGYPEHLAGNDIPLMARIIAVADVFDALTINLRAPMSIHRVLDIIDWECRYKLLDPAVVHAFFQLRVSSVLAIIHFGEGRQFSQDDHEILLQARMVDLFHALNRNEDERDSNEERLIECFARNYDDGL